jgi:hypothetical protein
MCSTVEYSVPRGTTVEYIMTETTKNPGQVSAYLDAWTLAQVQAYAKAEDRSVSWVMGFALKQFFVDRQGKPARAKSKKR